MRIQKGQNQLFVKVATMLGLLMIIILLLPWHSLAAASPIMTIRMPKTVEAGQQFVASVDIKNNPGWSALTLEIAYDSKNLELIDWDRGDAMSSNRIIVSFNESSLGAISMAGLFDDAAATVEASTNMTADGSWILLYFKVKPTASTGTDIKISATLKEMVNLKLEAQPLAAPAESSAKVGTMSAEDRKTLPNRTSTTAATGTTAGGQTGVDTSNVAPTGAGGDTKTNTSGNLDDASLGLTSSSSQGNGSSDKSDSSGLGWWWLVIGLAVVGLGAAVAAFILSRRSSGSNKS